MSWRTQCEQAPMTRRPLGIGVDTAWTDTKESRLLTALGGHIDVSNIAVARNEPRAAIDVWYEVGSLTAVVSRSLVDILSDQYSFRDYSSVRKFIEVHPTLLPFLFEAVECVRSVFPDSQLALERFVDPEEDHQHLVLCIRTSMEVEASLSAWNTLQDTWWLGHMDQFFCLLSLNIEFIDEL